MYKYCIKCGERFKKSIFTSRETWEKQRFCSVACSGTTFKKGQQPVGGLKTRFSKGHSSYERTEEYRKKMAETKKGCVSWMKGRKHTKEEREKISKALKGKPRLKMRGENNPNWTGLTSIYKQIRDCTEYKIWRMSVYCRDDFKCVDCGTKGGWNKDLKIRVILNADHIKAFALILEENNIVTLDEARDCKELWEIKNGRTLCADCHKKTNNYGKNTSCSSTNKKAGGEEYS